MHTINVSFASEQLDMTSIYYAIEEQTHDLLSNLSSLTFCFTNGLHIDLFNTGKCYRSCCELVKVKVIIVQCFKDLFNIRT